MIDEFNIVLAGVGGQGILLAAEILGTAAVKDGLNARVSEIHGMAQRGGAVVSNVRIGAKVLAPTVLDGNADIILGFEQIETLRNMKFASERTIVIMNSERLMPPELTAKKARYPSLEEIIRRINAFTKNVIVIEASKLAKEAGNILAQNTVLLGASAAVGKIPVKAETIIETLRELIPQKQLDVNIRAFNIGYEKARETAKP
jgi:indolepyruvate ferredoxin oxidoreductase beta subunit